MARHNSKSFLTIGGPGEQNRTNKVQPAGRVWEKSGEGMPVRMSYQPLKTLLMEFILAEL